MSKIHQIPTLLLVVFCMALNVSASSVTLPNQLVLFNDDNLGIIYTHSLQKNQTIYGLSKFFNTDIDKISMANPGVSLNAVKLNQTVNIPINTNMISSKRNLSPAKSYIPVLYTVKAKDNLFRVAKIYFDQSIDNVMKINNLKEMELSVGQKLLVGWYEYNPVYKEKLAWKEKGIEVQAFVSEEKHQTIKNPSSKGKMVFEKVISKPTDLPQPTQSIPYKSRETKKVETAVSQAENEDQEELNSNPSTDKPSAIASEETDVENSVANEIAVGEMEEEVKDMKLSSDPFENRNGIFTGDYDEKPIIKERKIRAQWNSKSKDKVNLFALHATAKTNSYIEIYNPMLERKIIAKVVGNIPPKMYKKKVELIVSPKVAESLGVKDKKFFVKVKFIE